MKMSTDSSEDSEDEGFSIKPIKYAKVIQNEPKSFSSSIIQPWDDLPYHYHLREDDALFVHSLEKCPVGLESLILTGKLFVLQTGNSCLKAWANKEYTILDDKGEEILLIKENKTCCKTLCGKYPLSLKILDLPRKEEIVSTEAVAGIFGGGGEMIVHHNQPVRNLIGFIEQETHCRNPIFSIFNSNWKKTLCIEGPQGGNCWGLAASCELNVFGSGTSRLVGKIIRNDPQVAMELKMFAKGKCRNTNNWVVEFARDLDPKSKTTLLCLVFLLDFQYYS